MVWKVFWHRCGPRHGNFGDVLTPLLLDYFRVQWEWAPPERSDFVGIGSICHQIPAHYKGVIWTSGNLTASDRNRFDDAQVAAVRGKRTLERTQCTDPSNVLLGDGGLLCHIFASPIRKRYSLGIIPHYVDEGHDILKIVASRSSDVCLIDICDEPRTVIRQVAQCKNILSSSLHGLILADSLRIPNRWMKAYGDVLGAGFKFHDYYSIFGIERPKALVVSPTDNLDTLLPEIGGYDRPNLDQIQESLLNSLRDLIGAGWSVAHTANGNSPKGAAIPVVQRPRSDGSEPRSKWPENSETSAQSSRRRIFVVGTGRSGTCWMGDLLGTHPAIRSFVEPKPVFDLVTALAVDPQRDMDLLEQIFREYDRLSAVTHPLHFADKTHTALWIAEKIAARYDDSVFIAMLRDMEPTVASMLQHRGVRRWCEQWDRYPVPNRFLGITPANLEWYQQASLLERCVARWWAHHNEIFRLETILGERLLTLKYETLVRDTCATLDTIRDFLDLRESFPRAIVCTDSLMKWKDYLSKEDIELMHRSLAFLSETG